MQPSAYLPDPMLTKNYMPPYGVPKLQWVKISWGIPDIDLHISFRVASLPLDKCKVNELKGLWTNVSGKRFTILTGIHSIWKLFSFHNVLILIFTKSLTFARQNHFRFICPWTPVCCLLATRRQLLTRASWGREMLRAAIIVSTTLENIYI